MSSVSIAEYRKLFPIQKNKSAVQQSKVQDSRVKARRY